MSARNFYKTFPTKVAFDRSFDVVVAVPDHAIWIDGYLADSADARRAMEGRLSVPYGPTVREHLDIFPPTGSAGQAPVLVFVHGGSWHLHEARDFSFVATGPLAAGMGVVIVTYDLCPDVTLPEIVRQVQSAVAWTWRNASDFGCSRDGIVVAGHSAGGQLAAMAALTDWSRYGIPQDGVKAVVPISGVFDLEPMALCDLQAFVRLTDRDIQTCSPSRQLRRVQAACLTVWGEDETEGFVTQSQDFAEGWTKAGNRGVTLALPGCHHFSVLEGLKRADSPLTKAVLSALSPDFGHSRPQLA